MHVGEQVLWNQLNESMVVILTCLPQTSYSTASRETCMRMDAWQRPVLARL